MFFYAIFAISLAAKFSAALCSCIILTLIALLGATLPAGGVLWTFFTNSIILEFTFGILLCLAYQRFSWMQGRNNVHSALLVALGSCLLWLSPEIPRFLGHGVPALLIVAGFLKLNLPNTSAVAIGVLLGDASYALYLAHPYIIQIPIKLLGTKFPIELTAAAAFASVAIALAISILIFRMIEKPAQAIVLKTASRLLHKPIGSAA
ncbi:hypothetical protein [Aureimonas sp. SA4125]|uniref:acyltransferase family protein n=1 Tax=Aureimonas sp. SA4125 TaxID=2826993 RepID=UPI001CC4B11B|nr:hypothetical protein [Aureimonas sp. SA4125]